MPQPPSPVEQIVRPHAKTRPYAIGMPALSRRSERFAPLAGVGSGYCVQHTTVRFRVDGLSAPRKTPSVWTFGICLAGRGVPLRRGGVSPREQPVGCCCILLISSRDSFGTLRLGKQARRDALWRGQGRGRLSDLLPCNVTVIVKLEAVLRGNVPLAASGAVVVGLARPGIRPCAIAARAFVVI
jgi:hypothetical protein